MLTPYCPANQKFSDAAHAAAQSAVYPDMLGCEFDSLSFESSSVGDGGDRAILDGQMAVDRIVSVTVAGLRGPIEHTVQERFRRPGYSDYRDLTITEWNHASNEKSELYKLKAGVFLYGYFDQASESFGEVIAVNTSLLLMAISIGGIRYTKGINRRSRQSFLCITFDALHEAGVVVWHRTKEVIGGR
jgi:hypothetical protein